MLNTYLTRFKKAVDLLHNDPRVQVVHFSPEPPASKADIARFEKRIQMPLDPALRAFYEQCNGLMLRWILKDDESHQASLDHYPVSDMSFDYTIGEYPQDQGRILLRPLDELTPQGFWSEGDVPEYYEDDTMIDDFTIETYELRQTALSFDLWSYSSFAVLIPRREQPFLVLHGSDHGAAFDDDRPCDAESYLEFVLACLGHCHLRYRAFKGENGAALPGTDMVHAPEEYWTKNPYSLEDMLQSS